MQLCSSLQSTRLFHRSWYRKPIVVLQTHHRENIQKQPHCYFQSVTRRERRKRNIRSKVVNMSALAVSFCTKWIYFQWSFKLVAKHSKTLAIIITNKTKSDPPLWMYMVGQKPNSFKQDVSTCMTPFFQFPKKGFFTSNFLSMRTQSFQRTKIQILESCMLVKFVESQKQKQNSTVL